MTQTRTQVLKFYIAYQDGRAEGDTEYDSDEEAEAARLTYPEHAYRGMYTACYWKTVGEGTQKRLTWVETVQAAEKRNGGENLSLEELLILAKGYEMTPEEVAAQRQSWVRQDRD